MLGPAAVTLLLMASAVGGDRQRVVMTGELVCGVKDALGPRQPSRIRRHQWSSRRCERVAAALREATDPVELFAVCINESDLRERAVAWVSPEKGDAGLCGVRCVLGDDGRCTNGFVKGMSLESLYDPVTNVLVAAEILAAKGSTSRYAGETVDRGYSFRVGVIAAALSGVLKKVRGRRLRDHVERIVMAVRGVPRS